MSEHPENPFQNYEEYMANGPFQAIKLLLPFLPAANQKQIVILIKFLELKYTMDYFKKNRSLSFSSGIQETASPLEKLASVLDFLPAREQESLEQMLNMMSVMEAFQATSETEASEEVPEEAPEEETHPEKSPPQKESLSEELPSQAILSQTIAEPEETVYPDSSDCTPSSNIIF
jgi:hypothetical protein